MVGIHYEVSYGLENSESDGCAFYNVYGPALEEVRSWGDKLAREYVHAHSPTERSLKSLKSAPIAEYLLTESGRKALDFDEIKRWERQMHLDDLRQFGMGSSGRVGGPEMESHPFAGEASKTLEDFRAELQQRYPAGSVEHDLILPRMNWDPTQQAYYILTVYDDTGENWSEAVLCHAANLYHASMVWIAQERAATGTVRCAGVQLAMGFHPVGYSPFHRLPGG